MNTCIVLQHSRALLYTLTITILRVHFNQHIIYNYPGEIVDIANRWGFCDANANPSLTCLRCVKQVTFGALCIGIATGGTPVVAIECPAGIMVWSDCFSCRLFAGVVASSGQQQGGAPCKGSPSCKNRPPDAFCNSSPCPAG